LVTTLLLADDDPDDRLLVKDALEETRCTADLRSVEDGVELMDYLRHRGRYTDPSEAPPPSLILLDLKMPRKSGHQALKEIKEDPGLRQIPVVILTTSRQEQDISRSYRLGVNSFITKPSSFRGLVETMRVLERYWFEIVTLPGEHA
jgi:two-component system, response regulator